MGLWERLNSELAYVFGALRSLGPVTRIANNPGRTFPDVVEELAREHSDRDALIDSRNTLSFAGYNSRANQYARWALAQGLKKGECVLIMMPNCADYYAAWLGIVRAGGVAALANTNLVGPSLAHSMNIVEPKHVVAAGSLVDAIETAQTHLAAGPQFWTLGEERSGWFDLGAELDKQSEDNLDETQKPALTTNDRCLYVYTSGTTGLPKAANLNHYRVMAIVFGFSAAARMKPRDRLYVCLPLYHSTGLLVAGGAALVAGASVVIQERFSTTGFWDDIVDHGCTAFAYVGEMCRYLVNAPGHTKEMKHRLRLAFGNGLRPDVWRDFQTRFKLPQILEWYASTEGNAVLLNFDGKIGSVGRIPKWAERKFVIEIVRFDYETEMPIRDEAGRCIKCEPNEVGEMISEILDDPQKPSQRFEGYADRAATERKVLRNVFRDGDAWFRTGDLLRKDRLGYFYFVDRVGDTFRWKGENVATSEVSEALTSFPGVLEANVYGVTVGALEGRAGMASLVADPDLDLVGLHTHIDQQLPDYARPLFIRLQHRIDATSTFKQRKIDLVKHGFDPERIHDPLFYNDSDEGAFVPITPALYQDLTAGRIQL